MITASEFLAEQKAIEGESIGWLPMEDGAYLHTGHPEQAAPVITIVGIPEASMAGLNVLLLT